MMCGRVLPVILSAVITGLSVICGCQNIQGGQTAEGRVSVETVHSGTVCNGRSPSPQVVWIDSIQKFKGRWQRMHSHRLGGDLPPAPAVDWDAHGLLLIDMGQKTSGGYAIKLARSHARLKDGVVFVEIHWTAPPSGAIVSMAVTSPCLLVKIQKGAYRSVVISDQSGRQRARVDVPG